MSISKSVNVSLAKNKKNKFDLSFRHKTTQDFFKIKPVAMFDLIPDEDITINMSAFTRLSPLSKPLYADVKQINRTFWVPYRTIMKGWNEFYEQTPYIKEGGNTPFILRNSVYTTCQTLAEVFVLSSMSSIKPDSQEAYDFNYYNGTSTEYRCFTDTGRKFYNILLSQGLKVLFPTQGRSLSDLAQVTRNMLPLLAYSKVWYDWFSNGAYVNRDDVAEILNLEPTSAIGVILTKQHIQKLAINITQLSYEADMFTQAWDNPSSPNNLSSVPTINFTDQSVPNLSSSVQAKVRNDYTNTDKTPVISAVNGGSSYLLTQFIDDALHHITDYIKRWQLVGTRVLDRYKAEYGIELPSEKLNRSVYLGKCDMQIQISDVTATNETEDQNTLGQYSGKGIGAMNNSTFKFHADEAGLIIVVSYISTPVDYPYGTPRIYNHIDRFSHYQNDFDTMGVSAVRLDELMCFDPHGRCELFEEESPDGVFGYLPRFYEYKSPINSGSLVSGDFLNMNTINSYRDWLIQRNFYDIMQVGQENVPKHSLSFTVADGQYPDDVFMDTNTDIDHFITQFWFKVDSYKSMSTLWDNYEFNDEDNHQHQRMRINGTNIAD